MKVFVHLETPVVKNKPTFLLCLGMLTTLPVFPFFSKFATGVRINPDKDTKAPYCVRKKRNTNYNVSEKTQQTEKGKWIV